MDRIAGISGWEQCRSDKFWGEIASSDHLLQFYDNDAILLDALAGFVSGGINAGHCSIVIATPDHLHALEERLASDGIGAQELVTGNWYLPVDAEAMLSTFMVYDWPDETLFNKAVTRLMEKARVNEKGVRAFGEMVAILWAKGWVEATVQLEYLWNKFCQREPFCLFCAYPSAGFLEKIITPSHKHICCSHSKMIAGTEAGVMEVSYKDLLGD